MTIERKVNLVMIALWFTLIMGAVTLDNVRAQTRWQRHHEWQEPFDWEDLQEDLALGTRREPTTLEISQAIQALQHKVKKLERNEEDSRED